MTDLLIDEIEYSSSYERRQQCFADLMDGNMQTFGRPSSGESWQDVIHGCPAIPESDQKVVAKALGMVVAVFRSAQMSTNNGFMLEDMLSPDRVPAVEEIEADSGAVALARNVSDGASALAFGRSVTIYKQMVENNLIQKDYLLGHMLQALDALPGSSKIHQSLVETAKQLISIDMESLM